MDMALTLRNLKALTDEELIERHDKKAENTGIGLDYYLGELRYREQSRIAQAIKDMTGHIRVLTIGILVLTFFILVLTVVNIVIWLVT